MADGRAQKKAKTGASASFLDDLLNETKSTRKEQLEHASVSSKSGQAQVMAADSMFSFLLEAAKGLDASNMDDIELEVRLGVIMGSQFVAEISKADFDRLINKLEATGGVNCKQTKHNDYIFSHYGEYERVRIRHEEGDELYQPQQKRSLEHDDLKKDTHMPYDARVSVAQETMLDPVSEVPDDWQMIREKDRKSYNFNSANRPWDVELTVVIERSRNVPARTLYEAEIEFHNSVLQWCKDSTKHDRLRQMIGEFWKTLFGLFGHTSKEPAFFRRVSREKNEELQQICNAALPQGSRVDFPGSMPINFSRRCIGDLQSKEYYVSEKTDGVRYFLVITPDGVYMCNRRYDFSAVNGASILSRLFPHSILDGEMVKFGKEEGKDMFLLFDVIKFKEDLVTDRYVPDRLKVIGQAIGEYRAHIDKNPNDKCPFELAGKVFMEKGQLKDLMKRIIDRHGERYYQDKSRYHKTDGLIFTCQNEGYQIRSAPSLFKWKYLDKLSVDFRVVIENNDKLRFYAAAGKDQPGIEYNFEQKLINKEEMMKELLAHERAKKNKEHGTIVEFKYDPWQGKWVYCTIRADKSTPNHIAIVMDTMEVMCENVTTDEITYRMSGRTGEEWKNKVEEHLQLIVEETQKTNPAHGASRSHAGNARPSHGHHGSHATSSSHAPQGYSPAGAPSSVQFPAAQVPKTSSYVPTQAPSYMPEY